jgi:LmbE family N-acetylglucosaminyl deacetylase
MRSGLVGRAGLWAGLVLAWVGLLPGTGVAAPQGEALLKTDLLGVFAHPDDETGVAPLIAHYALGAGKVVSHVYCTRGEGGGNMVGRQGGMSLGVLREAELKDCLGQLGVRHTYFLDREDFAYTEGLGITLEKWGHEATLGRLVRLVRSLRPEVMVTMNPAPTPGQHGNHQAAGWLAVEAFDAAADPLRFPEQIELEGLSVWRPRKLYFGGAGPFTATVVTTNALPDGRVASVVAGEALANHRSQGFGSFANSPWLRRPQVLQLVKSVVPFEAQESDLFRGLPVNGAVPARMSAVPPAKDSPPVGLRFLPRPAVSRYQEWVAEQKIESAAVAFDPDVPVVAGEDCPVPFEVLDFPGTPSGKLRIQVPEGWTVSPSEIEVGAAGKKPTYFRILQVKAPASAGDGEMVASGDLGGRPASARVRLHAVPRLTIPRQEGLLLGAPPGDAGWASLPSVPIPHTNTWQGTVTNAADVSATFRVAHDGESLWAEIRVRDDAVVSNIAPDDIRGHWRSDSVELCIDPAVGAEHTLGTYKVGIFPFDRAGKVRGARDADANPGLLERVSAGTRLYSEKLPDGYLIRVRVPWSEAGVDPAKAARIGLNVLVYDGDKTDAAPGENINRSRLAWAPRSGVQGRPEDWGRADLGK